MIPSIWGYTHFDRGETSSRITFKVRKAVHMDVSDISSPPNNVLLLEDDADDADDRLSVRLHLQLMGFVVYGVIIASKNPL